MKISTFKRALTGIVTLSTVLTLASCAGPAKNQVTADNKDTSGAFDGKWIAAFKPTQQRQTVRNLSLHCEQPMKKIALYIEDGVLTAMSGDHVLNTFVSSTGRFSLEVPSKYRAKRPAMTNVAFNNDSRDDGSVTQSSLNTEINYILYGDLANNTQSGKFIVGLSRLDNQGCATEISYRKQS